MRAREEDPAVFGLGDVGAFVGRHLARDVQTDALEVLEVARMLKNLTGSPGQLDRALDRDFGVAAHDDGIAVVTGMAPAPGGWIRASP